MCKLLQCICNMSAHLGWNCFVSTCCEPLVLINRNDLSVRSHSSMRQPTRKVNVNDAKLTMPTFQLKMFKTAMNSNDSSIETTARKQPMTSRKWLASALAFSNNDTRSIVPICTQGRSSFLEPKKTFPEPRRTFSFSTGWTCQRHLKSKWRQWCTHTHQVHAAWCWGKSFGCTSICFSKLDMKQSLGWKTFFRSCHFFQDFGISCWLRLCV